MSSQKLPTTPKEPVEDPLNPAANQQWSAAEFNSFVAKFNHNAEETDLKPSMVGGIVPPELLPGTEFVDSQFENIGTEEDQVIRIKPELLGAFNPETIPGYSATDEKFLTLNAGSLQWANPPVAATEKLAKPTLIAGSPSVNAVPLSWAAVLDAVFYEVIRSLNSGLTSPVIVYSGTGTNYTDTGLTADTDYWYALRAKASGFINSDLSTNVPVSTPEAGNITPPAPTAMVINDTSNTANFTYATGFTNIADYEYRINGGSWTTATVKPIVVGDIFIAIGALELRVKAASGRDASSILTNSTAFTGTPVTPSAPTNGVVNNTDDTFTFDVNPTYTDLSDYEYQVNGGAISPVTSNPIIIGDISVPIGQLKVRVKAVTGRNVSAWLTNASAFTIIVDTGTPIPIISSRGNIVITDNNAVYTNLSASPSGMGEFRSGLKLPLGGSGWLMISGVALYDGNVNGINGTGHIGFRADLNDFTNGYQLEDYMAFYNNGSGTGIKTWRNGSQDPNVTFSLSTSIDDLRIRIRWDPTNFYFEYSFDAGSTWIQKGSNYTRRGVVLYPRFVVLDDVGIHNLKNVRYSGSLESV